MSRVLISSALVIFLFLTVESKGYRTWRCIDHKCVKEETKNEKESISISECKVRCLKYGGLWPKPRGAFRMGNRTSPVNLHSIEIDHSEVPQNIASLLNSARDNFLARVVQSTDVINPSESNELSKISFKFKVRDGPEYFRTGADESYKLRVVPPSSNSRMVNVTVEANTFSGVIYGLETLGQLIFHDDIHDVYKMVDDVSIEDSPAFTHRGISLDTARSYISVENILNLLDVMAANKLNTFHWHITDSQSFPYVSEAYPELSENGAYSKKQVYTQNDIKKIVRYAKLRAVRVVPEFDNPAHVGEGWAALGPDLITCFKWQPWGNYCVEPPCGQLDPTNEKVYEILGTIFKEFVDLFHSDLFHLGGDEVNINCWNSTPRIQEWMIKNNYSTSNTGYYKLWGEYQEKVLKKLKATKADPPRAILWSSTLTDPHLLTKYLKLEDYIIQVWTRKNNYSIKSLIENKFQIIFSNYDELYFDCGGPSWVGSPGQNWCSPYIGWQYVYHHSPHDILRTHGFKVTEETKKLVLGSESAIWTEQIDNHNMHVRLWPRAAALGERLWSDPTENWTDAQFRMNHHRERMARIVPAELLQPQWCYQNDGFCD